MFIFKAGPRKVFRLKPVRCAKKVADPCSTVHRKGFLATFIKMLEVFILEKYRSNLFYKFCR